MAIDFGTIGETEGNILGFSPWQIIQEEFHSGNVASFASIAKVPAAHSRKTKTALILFDGISTCNAPGKMTQKFLDRHYVFPFWKSVRIVFSIFPASLL